LQFISEQDVAEAASALFSELITGLCCAFGDLAAGDAANIPRRRSVLPGGRRLQEMGGSFSWHGTSYIGTKTYASGSPFRGAPGLVLLYDANVGEVAAAIEAKTLGAWRTSAASALMISKLSQVRTSKAVIFGAGKQASWQLRGLLSVRPDIELVQVWSRDVQRSADFCGRDGLPADVRLAPIATSAEVAKDVDVLITATKSSSPLVSLKAVGEHTHVSAVGANQPQKRELDADLVAGADAVYVDDVAQAMREAGDLLAAKEEIAYDWSNVRPVSEIFRDGHVAAQDGITIFESQGIGLEDTVAAAILYEYMKAKPSRDAKR
jgi:ornithine cyclodeaminase/alanine dehydrogenase-like protein (mu-crystallin family)